MALLIIASARPPSTPACTIAILRAFRSDENFFLLFPDASASWSIVDLSAPMLFLPESLNTENDAPLSMRLSFSLSRLDIKETLWSSFANSLSILSASVSTAPPASSRPPFNPARNEVKSNSTGIMLPMPPASPAN